MQAGENMVNMDDNVKIVFYSDKATYEFRSELENQIKELDRKKNQLCDI